MDLLKAKIYLDKINRDFTRMNKDPENILRIDVDIMMSYVRELYDAMLSEPSNGSPAAVAPKKQVPLQEPAVTPAPPPPPPPAPVVEAVPPPEVKPAPAPPPPPPPVAAEPIKPPEPLPVVPPAPPPPPAAPSFPAVSPEAEALFEQKQAKELSEKLSELPIADLRKAIALNDRLLLTRELFGGDAQAFENAISALNNFSAFEQAKSYLLEHCVMRHRWTDKKHLETARNFIKLVRRRYN